MKREELNLLGLVAYIQALESKISNLDMQVSDLRRVCTSENIEDLQDKCFNLRCDLDSHLEKKC